MSVSGAKLEKVTVELTEAQRHYVDLHFLAYDNPKAFAHKTHREPLCQVNFSLKSDFDFLKRQENLDGINVENLFRQTCVDVLTQRDVLSTRQMPALTPVQLMQRAAQRSLVETLADQVKIDQLKWPQLR